MQRRRIITRHWSPPKQQPTAEKNAEEEEARDDASTAEQDAPEDDSDSDIEIISMDSAFKTIAIVSTPRV